MIDAPPPTAPPGTATLRPLRPGEERDVRRIFRATLLLGRPLPIDAGDLDSYTSLCLEWYLTRGTVIVVDVDGGVRGYLLACLDQADHDRWTRRAALRWTAAAVGRIASGRYRGDARRFATVRIRDGWATWRHAPPPPHGAHGHLNLDPQLRDAQVGHRLVAAMDELVAREGLDGWFGEVNVPEGRSLAAIERAGARVVHRLPNRTFTWLTGTAVERATVARPLVGATTTARAAAEAAQARSQPATEVAR